MAETRRENRMRRSKKLVNLEADPAWIEWVDGLARKAGASRATTIDQALRRLAMHLKYESLPPER